MKPREVFILGLPSMPHGLDRLVRDHGLRRIAIEHEDPDHENDKPSSDDVSI